MTFDIVTLFPKAFSSYFDSSMLKRAQQSKRVSIAVHDLREYTTDKHRVTDDRPYGGGAGMVLKVEPLWRAVHAITKTPKQKNKKTKIIVLAAGGKQFDQRMAEKFAKLDRLVLIAGHYEGVDERVKKFVDAEISVGPYVLTGGELPAMTIVDAVTRLISGVLGNPKSLDEESFSFTKTQKHKNKKTHLEIRNSKLEIVAEYPHYTRPEVFSPKKGVRWAVPKVLLSGDHKRIEEWRRKQMKKHVD